MLNFLIERFSWISGILQRMGMMQSCQGFHFRYFVPDKLGRRREKTTNELFIEAENKVMERITSVLKNRQDLLNKLACLEEGIEIHLLQGAGFQDYQNEVYLFGRATKDGDLIVMEFATDEVLYGGQADHEVMDVVIHELTHVLDFLDSDSDEDGFLPGWSKAEKNTFIKAREAEKERIQQGLSPLPDYALHDETEFLAVLIEVFFVHPVELERSNRVLYDLLKNYFKQDPAQKLRKKAS